MVCATFWHIHKTYKPICLLWQIPTRPLKDGCDPFQSPSHHLLSQILTSWSGKPFWHARPLHSDVEHQSHWRITFVCPPCKSHKTPLLWKHHCHCGNAWHEHEQSPITTPQITSWHSPHQHPTTLDFTCGCIWKKYPWKLFHHETYCERYLTKTSKQATRGLDNILIPPHKISCFTSLLWQGSSFLWNCLWLDYL